MKRLGAVLGVAVAATVAPATAAAAPVAVAERESRVVGSVQLQESGVAYLTQRPQARARGKDAALVVAAPGAPPRTVALLGSHEDDGYYSAGVATSGLTAAGGRGAFSLFGWNEAADKYGQGDYARDGHVNVIDLRTGAQTPVRTCAGPPPPVAHLSGSLVVTSGCRAGPAELRDLDRPQDPPRAFGERVGSVAIAGRKLAYRDDTGFAVVDVDSGATSRVEATAIGGTVTMWALQADGTLAFGTSTSGSFGYTGPTTKLSIARFGAAPALLAEPGPFSDLQLAADRVAYVSGDGLREVVVRPLDGGAPRTLARAGGVGGLSFDGSRIAYATTGCGDADHRVYVQPADDGEAADLTVNRCPPEIQYAEVDRRGRLRVTVVCPTLSPALPSDRCAMTATARGGGLGLGRSRRARVAGYATLTWPAKARLLRKRPRRIRVALTATMRGGTERVTATVRPQYPRRR